jgi:hypothetical protein
LASCGGLVGILVVEIIKKMKTIYKYIMSDYVYQQQYFNLISKSNVKSFLDEINIYSILNDEKCMRFSYLYKVYKNYVTDKFRKKDIRSFKNFKQETLSYDDNFIEIRKK